MNRAGVKVDAVGGICEDVLAEHVGEPGGQGASGGAREGAIQVSPVRQIPAEVQKAGHVHDGNRYESAVEPSQGGKLHDSPYDFHPVQLIAMYGGRDEQNRPVLRAVDYVHRHRQRDVYGQVRNGQVYLRPKPRGDFHVADSDDLGLI